MRVGMIGLGIMGSAMARNMVRHGLHVVGFDISGVAMSACAAEGCHTASSAREVAETTDVALTSLASVAAFHDVIDDLAQAGSSGAVIADTSTLPIAEKEIGRAALAKSGMILLDCPLSGTGAQAAVGDLVVFASGEQTAYEVCRPAFAGMSRQQRYLGAFGNGSRMKFVANHLVNIHNVAAAEAFVLGRAAGLDPEVIYEVIADSAGSSRMFQIRGPMMAKGEYGHATMKIETWLKDLQIISQFASDLHCPLALFTTAVQPYLSALAQGRGKEDTAAVCAVLEQAAGLIAPKAGR
jgi:putative dehydrogenase